MTALAMRATRALQKENGRRLLAHEEFLSQDEIAELIDKETRLPELISALRNIVTHADEDCPSQYRTDHFREALMDAVQLLEEPK